MRIGLNLTYLVDESGGSGTYARELIPRLLLAEPKLVLTAWIGSTAPADLREEPWASEVRWIRLPVAGVGAPWRLWYELVGIGIDARRRGLDLIHGLANITPLAHPGLVTVTTIHDVIWIHHPETASAEFRTLMRAVVPLVGRTSSRLIAISEAARDDIASTLHLDPTKFDVAPHGVRPPPSVAIDLERVASRLELGPEPVVLCVAAKRRHKNLDGLVRAFAAGGAPGAQLVLVGAPTAYGEEVRALAQVLGVESRVRCPGWVSEADLEGLYRLTSCFVLASYSEGFGLPVLEALARGVPVACSEIPALRELAGDAALYFDPADTASIAQALTRVVSDKTLSQQLSANGVARARNYTWGRTAQDTLTSYRRALGHV